MIPNAVTKDEQFKSSAPEEYIPSERDVTLLEQTFLTFQDAVTTLGTQKIKALMSDLYIQVNKSAGQQSDNRSFLNDSDIEAIADRLVNIFEAAASDIIMQPLEAYRDLHQRYKEEIQQPFHLAPLMKEAREIRADAIAGEVAGHLKDSANAELPILDFGCGGGRPALALAEKTHRQIIAADIADFLAEEVKEKPDAVVFSCIKDGKLLDNNNKQLADGSIGDAFASYAFHHADPDEVQKEFNELGRVITPGGRLVVLETAIADIKEPQQEGYLDRASFLKAQLLDFVTSNFFREEPVMMPVPGSYHEDSKWTDNAEQAGFRLVEKSGQLTVDDFGEACQYMIYEKLPFTEKLQQHRAQEVTYERSC